ncbi:MAG: cell wall hydrolase, partial [Alphaproteobacteria bacterium]|nr:cell wall hydrolase [Alphaproteobacteria bacterium]
MRDVAIIPLAALLLICRTAAAEPGPAPERTLVDADPAEVECLALNIYFEGRGEPTEGRVAVAQVTLNRVAHPDWPKTVCGVVRQGGPMAPCQFSWYCDGLPDRPTDRAAWRDAQALARDMLSG